VNVSLETRPTGNAYREPQAQKNFQRYSYTHLFSTPKRATRQSFSAGPAQAWQRVTGASEARVAAATASNQLLLFDDESSTLMHWGTPAPL